MRSDLIRVKLPRKNPSGGMTWAYRWIKPKEYNITFPHKQYVHNNTTYLDSLKAIAYSKIKSDLFLPITHEIIKNNIISRGLALDENYGAIFGKFGLAIYLIESPPGDKETLLLKGNIQYPLVVTDLDKLQTPEDIFVFNLQNTLGDPSENEFLGEEWTKKILMENIDCIIYKEEDGMYHFAIYSPGKLFIVNEEEQKNEPDNI